jgi:hypothetical protein
MMHKASENIKSLYGCLSTALGGETSDIKATGTFINGGLYDLIEAYGLVSGVASGSVVTLEVWQATTSAGAGSKTLTTRSTDTFTSAATSETDLLRCQARGEDLDVAGGFNFVGAKISTNNTSGTEVVGIVLNGLRARFAQATLP